MRKKVVSIVMIIALLLTGCVQGKNQDTTSRSSDKTTKQSKIQEEIIVDDGEEHDRGVLSMKLKDSKKLTEQQKKVIEY